MTGSRWQTFSHALAFVLGFSLVFVLLGASVAFIGNSLNAFLPTFVKIGGAILIVFGLEVAGVLDWLAERLRAAGRDRSLPARGYIAFTEGLARVMYTEGRVQARVDRRWGYLSSALMGVFFSAGWIPCIGPVLSAIYLLASDAQTAGQGALLLLVYSLGLGIPFLLTGAAFSTMTGWLRRVNRYLGVVSKITGAFLIAVGILLFMDRLAWITVLAQRWLGTGFATVSLGSEGMASAAISMPIAFLAGLLSFLSPCVLPLIPAYIGYLSGTVVAGPAQAGAAPGAG